LGRIKKQISITLEPKTFEALENYCKKSDIGLNRSEFIQLLLEVFFHIEDLEKKIRDLPKQLIATTTKENWAKIGEALSDSFAEVRKIAIIEAKT
jgi:hypothetical protein